MPPGIIILPTILVQLSINDQIVGYFRAMCDSGSQVNLIRHNIIKTTERSIKPVNLDLIGITETSIKIKNKVIARIQPWFNHNTLTGIETEFLLLPKSSNWSPTYPSQSILPYGITEPMKSPVADPLFWRSGSVPILLGVEIYSQILNGLTRKVSYNLTEQMTSYGNVIMGTAIETTNNESTMNAVKQSVHVVDLHEIDKNMQRFWEFEDIKLCTKKDAEHEMVKRLFAETHYRDESGCHYVKLPLKPCIKELGSSREVALKRFFMLEKRAKKEPEYWKEYVKFMSEYEKLGHMIEATIEPKPGEMVYYIPHHGINLGTKFRVVFDGSCETNKGISLNDAQFVGPKLQRDLHDIVMRFRRHKVAINADIAKMYRQVRIDPEHWNLHRIFWRTDPSLPLKEYWLVVVTYGLASSPYLSVECMNDGATAMETEFPDAANAIKNDFYMDDGATGADDEEKAIILAKDIDYVLKKSGFQLRKWRSNSAKLVQELTGDNDSSVLFDEEGKTSVLGIKWLPMSDEITYEVRAKEVEKLTKRNILSIIYKLYDPNGLVAPVIIRAKLLMQNIWKAKLEWDEIVSPDIAKLWESMWSTINELSAIRIPRWIGTKKGANCQLHGFADSSGKAYGCAIYIRIEHAIDNIETNLIMAKSKVAPIKTVSIPRLELAAAHLLSQLFDSVRKSMEMENVPYYLWSDNIAALQWIKKDLHELKIFVANRVRAIREVSNPNRWNHVRSEHNPADLISRGVAPKEIVHNKLWWKGPKWLNLPQNEWPQPVNIERFACSEEAKKEFRINLVSKKLPLQIMVKNGKEPIPLLEYSNTCAKLRRIIVYVQRFIKLCQNKNNIVKPKVIAKTIKIPLPSREEEREAMKTLIQMHQQHSYPIEWAFFKEQGREIDYIDFPKQSKIISLHPFMDNDGIIRVGNRAKHSSLPYDSKHPIIIEHASRLSQLIISESHAATGHGSVQTTMQYIRCNYWIPKLREQLRSHISKCVTCAKWNKKVAEQLMCDLPADRVNQNRAFLITGVDYAGPIDVVERYKSVTSRRKAWIAIFVCMVTRAVHIELVSDQSSNAFLMSYERFVNRRGHCERLYSDNAKYFKGAHKELRAAFKEWHKNSNRNAIQKMGTDWIFMKERAPHQIGIYEAAVKSTKYHLHRMLGRANYTFEHLNTFLIKIEAILNSRPLYSLSDDPNDFQAITPAHFLINEPIVMPPPIATPQKTPNPIKRIRDEQQKLLQSFWKVWRKEYLATLVQRKKWVHEKEPIKIGQLVIIDEDDLVPTDWTLGKIVEIIPSKDGIIRAVKVRTKNKSVLVRPIQRLCILPLEPCAEGKKPKNNEKADKTKYSKSTIQTTLKKIHEI